MQHQFINPGRIRSTVRSWIISLSSTYSHNQLVKRPRYVPGWKTRELEGSGATSVHPRELAHPRPAPPQTPSLRTKPDLSRDNAPREDAKRRTQDREKHFYKSCRNGRETPLPKGMWRKKEMENKEHFCGIYWVLRFAFDGVVVMELYQFPVAKVLRSCSLRYNCGCFARRSRIGLLVDCWCNFSAFVEWLIFFLDDSTFGKSSVKWFLWKRFVCWVEAWCPEDVSWAFSIKFHFQRK